MSNQNNKENDLVQTLLEHFGLTRNTQATDSAAAAPRHGVCVEHAN
jgi:hypothetical protein